MVKPLSNDLRKRVVAFVEAGHSRRATAAHFRVSPSFVIKLMMLFRQTGRIDHRPIGEHLASRCPATLQLLAIL